MSDDTYRRIIGELSDFMAVADPDTLIETQHMNVGDTTVALTYNAKTAPDVLFVYIDLGPIPAAMRQRVLEGMLRANLRPDADAVGHFGVHGMTGHSFWHLRLRSLDSLHGADLGALIAQQIEGLRGWMERIAAPVRELAA